MPLSVRLGVGSLDDVLSSVRVHHYLAGTVVCAFDKRRLSLAVMGLLNDEGDVLEVSTDSLGALSALLATPFSSDVIRLAYPRVDLNLSGQVMLRVPVDEPVWSRVLTNVELDVQAGLRVSGDDIRDALSVSLDALGVPSGSVVAERSASGSVSAVPDVPVFEPVTLTSAVDGAGASMAWSVAEATFPHEEVARALVSLVNELALRAEGAGIERT